MHAGLVHMMYACKRGVATWEWSRWNITLDWFYNASQGYFQYLHERVWLHSYRLCGIIHVQYLHEWVWLHSNQLGGIIHGECKRSYMTYTKRVSYNYKNRLLLSLTCNLSLRGLQNWSAHFQDPFEHKSWLGKIWQINKHSPNSSKFCRTKVSLYMVYSYIYHFHTSDQRVKPWHNCDIALALEC